MNNKKIESKMTQFRVFNICTQLHPQEIKCVQQSTTFAQIQPLIIEASKGWKSQPDEFDYELEVEGTIPKEIRGTLFRNGPGLMEVYDTPLVHPIDGDGMICSLCFDDGKAHFRSRYVQTKGYQLEKRYQKMMLKGMMGTMPPVVKEENIKDKIPNQRGFKNPSNTNVYYWGGKLLACWESGLPYSLNPTTLETIGRDDLNGTLSRAKCLAAHFRYDPAKNTLVTFSHQVNHQDYGTLYIYEFDHNWNIVCEQVHQLDKYYYCHDFLLTENYFIFHQSPFVNPSPTNLAKMVTGTAPGQLMRYYPEIPCKMILIPRNPTHTLRFFNTDPCHIFHHLNAWEDQDKIHFSSICFDTNFKMEWEQKLGLSNTSTSPGFVHNYTIDLGANKITRMKVDDASCEFPTTNPLLNGKKWRYAYLMAADKPHKPIPYMEIVKFDRDLQQRKVWSARSENGVLGEPVFVPKPSLDAEEDEGWIIVQLYNCAEHKTQFVILDAQRLEKGPIARLKLKHHTPYGFHGTFTPQTFL